MSEVSGGHPQTGRASHRIDAKTDRELARYLTGPPEQVKVRTTTRYNIVTTTKLYGGMRWGKHSWNSPNVKRVNAKSKTEAENILTNKFLGDFNVYYPERKIIKTTQDHYEPIYADPVTTAMDFDGNVWVANRGYGTVVKILHEGGYDSNENGLIDTSENILKEILKEIEKEFCDPTRCEIYACRSA